MKKNRRRKNITGGGELREYKNSGKFRGGERLPVFSYFLRLDFCFLILACGLLLLNQNVSFAREEDKRKVEVTFIETEIGFDQAVEEGPSIKPDFIYDKKGGEDAAGTKEEKGNPEITISRERIVQTSTTLKKLIEQNRRLRGQIDELDLKFRNVKGQRAIEVNRLNNVVQERDKYREESERIIELNRQSQMEMRELRQALEEKEQFLAARQVARETGRDVAIFEQQQSEREKILAERISELEGELLAKEKELLAVQEKEMALASQLAEKDLNVKQQLRTAIESTREQHERQAVTLRQQIVKKEKEREKEKNSLQTEIKKLEENIVKTSYEKIHEVKNLKAQIKGLQDTLAQEKNEKQTQAGALKQQIADLQNDLRDMRELKETQTASMKKNIFQMESMFAELKEKKSQEAGVLKEEINTIQTQLAEAQKEKESGTEALQAKIDGLQARLTSVTEQKIGEMQLLQSQISRLQGKLTRNLLSPVHARATGEGSVMSQEQSQAIVTEGFAPSEGVFSTDLAIEVIASQNKGQGVVDMIDQMNLVAAQIKSDEAKIHYNMGNVFFNRGKYHRALKEYRVAVKLTPDDPNAHFNLAFVASEYINEPKVALDHYRHYLHLSPKADDVDLVKEKILEAELFLKSGKVPRLEKDFQNMRNEAWR